MEKIEGMPLNKLIHRNPGSRQELVPLMLGIIDVVAYLHSRRIYHRDIKPSNIMVTTQQQIKLIDFGDAIYWPDVSEYDSGGNKFGGNVYMADYVGTSYYLLPEAQNGLGYKIFHHDTWAMAVTFLDMVQGYGIGGDEDDYGHDGTMVLLRKHRTIKNYVRAAIPKNQLRKPYKEWKPIYDIINEMLKPLASDRLSDLAIIRERVAAWGNAF